MRRNDFPHCCLSDQSLTSLKDTPCMHSHFLTVCHSTSASTHQQRRSTFTDPDAGVNGDRALDKTPRPIWVELTGGQTPNWPPLLLQTEVWETDSVWKCSHFLLPSPVSFVCQNGALTICGTPPSPPLWNTPSPPQCLDLHLSAAVIDEEKKPLLSLKR